MNPDDLHSVPKAACPADDSSGERTLGLLQKIKSGAVDPKCIGPSERRRIVSYLIGDGYSTAEMAQILKVSDRSIERDKKAIREANALAASPELVEQMVGRLACEAELSIQRIRKSARDKNAPPAVRIDAEHRCYQIVRDMIASLRHLGYLPTAASKLQADVTHNIGQLPTLADMQGEIQRLRRIAGNPQGADSQLSEQFDHIETVLERVELAGQIEDLSKTVEGAEIHHESD